MRAAVTRSIAADAGVGQHQAQRQPGIPAGDRAAVAPAGRGADLPGQLRRIRCTDSLDLAVERLGLALQLAQLGRLGQGLDQPGQRRQRLETRQRTGRQLGGRLGRRVAGQTAQAQLRLAQLRLHLGARQLGLAQALAGLDALAATPAVQRDDLADLLRQTGHARHLPVPDLQLEPLATALQHGRHRLERDLFACGLGAQRAGLGQALVIGGLGLAPATVEQRRRQGQSQAVLQARAGLAAAACTAPDARAGQAELRPATRLDLQTVLTPGATAGDLTGHLGAAAHRLVGQRGQHRAGIAQHGRPGDGCSLAVLVADG